MADAYIRLISTPWFFTPGTMAPGLQMFAIGDVHGQGTALEHTLIQIAQTPRQAPKRVLIFLGDLIDRGPDSFACLDMARHGAELAQCDTSILLAGNHEIMLAQGLLEPHTFLEGWLLCGGYSLLPSIGLSSIDEALNLGMDNVAQRITERLPQGWAQHILNQPGYWTNGDALCVHAGIHPHQPRETFLHQKADAAEPIDHHWAWIREPFLSWNKGWDPLRKTIVLHGHTPAINGWIGSDGDLAQLVRLDKRRICLDADAAQRPQIAWCEWTQHKARIGCVQIGRDDAF